MMLNRGLHRLGEMQKRRRRCVRACVCVFVCVCACMRAYVCVRPCFCVCMFYVQVAKSSRQVAESHSKQVTLANMSGTGDCLVCNISLVVVPKQMLHVSVSGLDA